MSNDQLKGIKGKKFMFFMDWINSFADFDNNKRCLDSKSTIGKDKKPNHITEFGAGYHQCISDIYRFLIDNEKYKELSKVKKGGTK